MSNLLFFDTETTGLPLFKLPDNHASQPAVLQIGAILTTPLGEVVEEYSTLVKIGSKPIHPMALKAHGISASKANSEGIPPEDALVKFHEMALQAEVLVCHNFDFDFKLIKIMAASLTPILQDADLLMGEIEELPYHCTMKKTIDFCRLPFPSGRKGFKFPKLEELHKLLFDEDFEGAHDALADVTATKRCYFELKTRGVF